MHKYNIYWSYLWSFDIICSAIWKKNSTKFAEELKDHYDNIKDNENLL